MIKLIKTTFYDEKLTKEALVKFINSAKQLSFGQECVKFEKNFAKYQGRKHCVFFNSGSFANLAVFQALLNLGRIKKEDRVGFSALTWSTNVMPLIQLGLSPAPVDIELNTLNVSSKKLIETMKTAPLKVMFITNLLGLCDDIDKIKEICASRGTILVEDNCEALGTIYKGKKLGNFGLASTFSFFVGHHMSTIEGGAVCTDDDDLANMLRLVRAHGWDRNLEPAQQKVLRDKHGANSFYAKYTFYDLGYNTRPTEIAGFIASLELKNIKKILGSRNKNFLRIAPLLYGATEKYVPIKFDHIDFVSSFAIPVICRSKKIHDELVKKCHNKIEIRPIVGGDMTRQPFFKKYLPMVAKSFKNSNSQIIHERGLYFGNNPQLSNKEISQILNVFA
jgi:CDP-6-deoxy-D-xylo-4-hexulose-3-dehydrase